MPVARWRWLPVLQLFTSPRRTSHHQLGSPRLEAAQGIPEPDLVVDIKRSYQTYRVMTRSDAYLQYTHRVTEGGAHPTRALDGQDLTIQHGACHDALGQVWSGRGAPGQPPVDVGICGGPTGSQRENKRPRAGDVGSPEYEAWAHSPDGCRGIRGWVCTACLEKRKGPTGTERILKRPDALHDHAPQWRVETRPDASRWACPVCAFLGRGPHVHEVNVSRGTS